MYCTLTIADGATISNAVNGFGLPPLAAKSQLSLDITVGAGRGGHAAGTGSDGDDPAVENGRRIEKLTPDRDLQCYFFEPSAIAALSSTSASGFTVSGTWRQQFDWAVIEWNRDNMHEHPAFRYLPDGDLSGLTLTYQETRTNCIPLDSDLFATVDWPCLRVWATHGGAETIYLRAADGVMRRAVAGSYQCAYADFTLSGTVAAGDFVGLAFLEEAIHVSVRQCADILWRTRLRAITDAISVDRSAFAPTLLKATQTRNDDSGVLHGRGSRLRRARRARTGIASRCIRTRRARRRGTRPRRRSPMELRRPSGR